MDLNAFIESLALAAPAEAGYLEEDRTREVVYMREHVWRFRAVHAALPDSAEPLRIADIGPTPFTLWLRENYPRHELWAVDLTPLLRERFAARGIEHRTCNLDRDPLPLPDAHFDVVIFTETLEHVFAPPGRVLADVRRVLRPGGRLILSVPNFAVLHNRIKLLFGRGILGDPDHVLSDGSVHGHGHLHEYLMPEITALVRRAGFRVETRRFLSARPGDALACRHRSRLVRGVRASYAAVQACWPAFRTTLLVVATRT